MSDRKEISAAFPYESRFVEVNGSKLHYIEEGSGDPVLFLHGNPTSSYLWRNIIPHVSPSHRAVALDLIGMGKSDKPDIEYRFFDHYEYVEGFIERLGLENITFVVHDWGSALGLHYARQHEGNARGIAMMEAILAPVPSWDEFPSDFEETIRAFRTPEVGWDMVVNQNMFVEKVLPAAVVRDLSDEEMARYREPYIETESRKPVWRWPNELPIAGEPADVVDAVATYNGWLQETEIPKLLFHATPGAIVPAPLVEWCRANLKNLETVELGEGIHFLQEDHPHEIGDALSDWLSRI
ncbi:MAG: haloalkane dehalogenase [Gemmatimonadetes bacterium]|uniref:Haloalkane dehalogenase n=1 Tax=Candidatus Kutchimonas denitrificans TaxID=3056748 RepID=A0AAE5CCP2_9BACT|nr:haloalkane dehalogenase [Gemmatimonadota bacterium]NIR74459.1 haloalkane dehalogenase [Candidatus Kutchimonas denitrificans]NIS00855.1 haloalkane dehalogenase [Gemmatimonadota bacterium]NIT66478.1 haloalkane dehalogenase [Gemmatimonadota bacterium]NIU52109.1 haloalkane dehalogenase [Gemmatimonadota bacterium]